MVFDIYEIHGDEREVKGFRFPRIRAVPGLRPHNNHDLQARLICEDQSLDYDFSAAAERAQTACPKTESKQPKKTSSTTEVKCEHMTDSSTANAIPIRLGSRCSLFGRKALLLAFLWGSQWRHNGPSRHVEMMIGPIQRRDQQQKPR